MGLVRTLLSIVGLLVLAAIGLGAFLWFSDYEAQGVITEKGRDASGDYVVIRPTLVPYDYRQPLESSAAAFVCEGYQVTYRIQSGYYTVRDQQGRLVYDSNDGLTDLFSPVRCSALL